MLSDMSGLYADIGGRDRSLQPAWRSKIFNPANHNIKVEILSTDHQNKPDIGSEIARRWYDVDHVNAIATYPTPAWHWPSAM